MLVYEKCPLLEGDSTTSPRSQAESFRVPTMPSAVCQSVLHDNRQRMFESHLYSPEFFHFLVVYMRTASEAGIDLSLLATEFATGLLAQASANRMLPELVAVIIDMFRQFTASCELFVASLVNDNLQLVCQTMLVCSEKPTRSALKDLYVGSANALAFEPDSLPQSFIASLLSFIPHEVSKNWPRFAQFWELFSDFAAAGHAQSLFLLEKGVFALFIDFYLGGKSPLLQHGEERQVLGSKLWSPNYDGLVRTLSVLDKYCATNRKDGHFQLSEEDKKCLMSKEFYDKTLRHGYDCEALGEIVQHWCWEDQEFSEMIAQVLLKGLNEIDYDEVRGYYTVLQAFVTIEDPLNAHRIEWVMGFPAHLFFRHSSLQFPVFGAAMISSIEEEVIGYATTLAFGFSAYDTPETVLSLIWKHRKRWDHYCIMNIKSLLEIALQNNELAAYLVRAPAPTYQFCSYFEWIESHILATQKALASSLVSTYSYNAKNEEYSAEAASLYAQLREQHPRPAQYNYVIASSTAKSVVQTEEKNDVRLTVTEFTTKWAQGLTDGAKNLAFPEKLLKAEFAACTHNPREEEMPLYSSNATDTEDPPTAEAPTLLKFEAYNMSSNPKRVELQLKTTETSNFWAPLTPVTLEISPYTQKDAIVLCKLLPESPWGTVDYSLEVAESRPFELSTEHDDTMKESSVVYYATEDAAVNVSGAGSVDDDTKAPAGQKKCPRCTLHNSEVAKTCTVCEYQF